MRKLALKVIGAYSNNSVGFWLGSPYLFYSNCKYHPTCSEYMVQSIEKYGLIKGLSRGILRVLRCNPLLHGGVDLP